MKHLLALPLMLAGVYSPAYSQVTWTQLQPVLQPPARSWHGMAYDALRDRVIMFGGRTGSTTPNPWGDTWEFDGSKWIKQSPPNPPQARWGHAMFYDPNLKRTVLYGGATTGKPYSYLSDTWLWDGKNWTQLSTSKNPGPLFDSRMVYDPQMKKLVLFGGFNGKACTNATWTLSATGWQPLPSQANPPSIRASHGLVFDHQSNQLLMQGGNNSSGLCAPTTWAFNGKVWQALKLPQDLPKRANVKLFRSDRAGRIGFFAGTTTGIAHNDFWHWDGTTWTQDKGTHPSKREGQGMVYDSRRGRTVMFSGSLPFGANYFQDTWTLVTSIPTLYGTGTAHCGGVPKISASAQPAIGHAFTIQASNTHPANAVGPISGYYWMSTGEARISFPCAGSKKFWINVDLMNAWELPAIPTSNGLASATLPIPSVSILIGMKLHFQYVTYLPARSNCPCYVFNHPLLGFAASKGLLATIQ